MTIDIDLTKFSDADLIALNRRIVAFIRDKRQADTYHQMARFNLGDCVSFINSLGETVTGIVIRVNKKTVSIHSDIQQHWNVSPHLLKKVGESCARAQPVNMIELFEAAKK